MPFFLCCLAACDRNYPSDDLEAAREAAEELDWTQSARLLQRYLRDEMDDSRRWEAWKLLHSPMNAWESGNGWWKRSRTCSMNMKTVRNSSSGYCVNLARSTSPCVHGTRLPTHGSGCWMWLIFPTGDAARLYEHMGLYYQRGQKFDMAEDMFVMGLEHAG